MAKALHEFALASASKVLTLLPILHAFPKASSARVDELPKIADSPTVNAAQISCRLDNEMPLLGMILLPSSQAHAPVSIRAISAAYLINAKGQPSP
jgi:hypothetical protein